MQHSLLRLSFYFLCLFIVSDAAIKFEFLEIIYLYKESPVGIDSPYMHQRSSWLQ